ncbi:hypothetical protein ABT160_23960 [Streptomyces sp. NPDC001941]|uniref:hypothetical protein n=1 Tax=Streptomyces sp. NPDC001941 TaxID=3154659 RepID=UPI0033223DC2
MSTELCEAGTVSVDDDRSHWRSSRTWILVLSVGALLLGLAGCSQSSGDVLEKFRLEFPDCSYSDRTFSGTTDWPRPHVAMSFTTDRECADQYLKNHGVDLEDPSHWPTPGSGTVGGPTLPPDYPPFESDAMDQFKLKLDPKRQYDLYHFKTGAQAEFKVLLDPEGDRTGVYMESVAYGKVRGGS